MDSRCISNLPFLALLVDGSSKKLRKVLIENCTPEQLRCILEIFGNVLYGNIPISLEVKESLKKNKKFLLTLWHTKERLEIKRNALLKKFTTTCKVLDAARGFFLKIESGKNS